MQTEPMPQGNPDTDPIEAFAAMRVREIGSDADFEAWAGESLPAEDVWELLDDFAMELNGGEDPEWPWADCPVGCRQRSCVHGPNRN